jgi:AcrR family transcriptional regulator
MRQAARSGQTRQLLLAATIELILERGLAGATVNVICRRAGVTTGALQHQFGGKSELMAATVATLFAPFAEPFPSSEKPADTPLDARVERLTSRFARIFLDVRYPAVIEILSATRHDKALDAAVKTYRDVQLENMEHHLRTQFPDVNLPLERMVEETHLVVDLMRGGAIRMMFGRSREAEAGILDGACRILHAAFAGGSHAAEAGR